MLDIIFCISYSVYIIFIYVGLKGRARRQARFTGEIPQIAIEDDFARNPQDIDLADGDKHEVPLPADMKIIYTE